MKTISFETILQLQTAYAEIPTKDKAIFCVTLQGHNNSEFRQFGLDEAANLTEEQIVTNLVPLIEMKTLRDQAARDLTGNLLSRVSSEKLAENFLNMIALLHSTCYFVREETLLLLDKIEPESLVGQFDYLRKLEKEEGNFDIRRMAKNSLLKIVKVWNIAQKIEHCAYAVELQNSTDSKESSVGNLLILQIMETWKTEKVKPFLPFLIDHTDTEKNEFATSETASFLALKVLLDSEPAVRIANLDYITSFSYSDKVLRRLFRNLALETLSMIDEQYLSKFAFFLLQCLEAKSKIDRKLARGFLEKIDPNKLPVKDLLYFQASELWRVRWACKKFAHRISEDILFDNLEVFIDLQKSLAPNVRYLASQLATSISIDRLRLKKDLLQDCAKSKDPYVVDLAECLLCLV